MQQKQHIFFIIFSLFIFQFSQNRAQGIQDSIFEISSVDIFGEEKFFDTKEAGLKENQLDTLILQNNKGQSLASLLATNTPVFIKSHGRGALATASLRGTAASHTKVNWNGININSPMLGMVDFSQIPVFLIDDISLKYGNSSLSEQGGGLGGTINLNNTPNWNNHFSGKYLQTFGSYSSFDELLAINLGNNRFQSKSKIYHTYSENDYTFYNRSTPDINYQTGDITHPLDTNNNASYTLYGLQQEFYIRTGNDQFASLKYWGQNSERSIPQVFSNEGGKDSNRNQQSTIHHNLVADWKYYKGHSKLDLLSGLIFKEMLFEQLYLVNSKGLQHSVYSESLQKSWFNSAKYNYFTPNGYHINASLSANLHAVDTKDTVSHTGYNKKQSELSAYISIQKRYFKNLNLNLMLRQELINGDLIPIMPLLGFDYKLDEDENFVIKGNISRNYHSATLNDKYWQPGGNPDLKPEEGYSTELGFYFRKNIDSWFIKGEISTYYSKISNWILWLPNVKGYWEPINLRTVASKGIELNAKLHKKLGKNSSISILGNYAYTPTLNKDNEAKESNSYNKQLVYIPLHSADIMARVQWMDWNFSWQHSSYGIRYTTTSNDPSARRSFPPYYMNDISLDRTWVFTKFNLKSELKINNLFNENYRSAIYHPMPGRNYKFILTFEF